MENIPIYAHSLAYIKKKKRALRTVATMAQRVVNDHFGTGEAETDVFYETPTEISIRVLHWAGYTSEYRFNLKSDIETEFRNALRHDYAL